MLSFHCWMSQVAILLQRMFGELVGCRNFFLFFFSADICELLDGGGSHYKNNLVSVSFSSPLLCSFLSDQSIYLYNMPTIRKSKAKAKRSYVSLVIRCMLVLQLTHPSISPSVSSAHSLEVEGSSRFFLAFSSLHMFF